MANLIEQGVIAGGMKAVHARSDQFSEHRPHMQIIFDNYTSDPKHPGHLRNDASRAWFSHRDVAYPEGHAKAGQKISGQMKLSLYQEGLREGMVERGWPVEREIDADNQGIRRLKKSHAKNDDQRIIAEDRLAAAKAIEQRNAANALKLETGRQQLNQRARQLVTREEELTHEHTELAKAQEVAQSGGCCTSR